MMKQLIKCNLSWKSLKLLFFSLLTSCFILLGNSSVNAWYTQLIGVENYPSLYDNNYSLSFLKGWWFLSSFLWQWRSVLALKSNDLVWWAPNWYLYAYLKYSSDWAWLYQGFFDRYYSCDEITDFWSNMPWNCSIWWYITFSWSYVDSNREVFKSFFSKVKPGDFFFYDYLDVYHVAGSWDWRENRAIVCWSSSEIGKSICFNWWLCTSNYSSNCNPLINSQGLRDNITFSSLETSWIWSAPWQFWYNNEVPTTWWIWSPVVNEQTTFNALYNQWYRSQMCYWWFGLDDLVLTGDYSFSWIQLNSWATIFELYDVYSWWKSFVNWYDDNYIDYLYLSSFHNSEDLAYFLWKSKWLVWLWIVRETLFAWDEKDFRSFWLRTFCQYYFSWVWLSTDISPGLTNEQIQNSIFNDIVSDIWVLIPIPWSPLDQLFENATDDWSIDPNCLSWDLNSCLTQSWFENSLDLMWRSWSVAWIKEGVDWILPGYIVIWFLWILLLYYIRR